MEPHLIAEIEGAENSRDKWKQLLKSLIGAEQLWLAACRQAVVEAREEWLARYLPREIVLRWPLDLMAYRTPPYREVGYQEVARALATCAQTALLLKQVSSGETDRAKTTALAESLYQAAVQWQRVRLPEADAVGEPDEEVVPAMRRALRRTDTPQQQLEAMLWELRQTRKEWQLAPVRDLVLYLFTGQRETWERSVQLQVLLDRPPHDRGLVATLLLESRADGVGQFYGDPLSMAFFEGDAQFQEALARAWEYAQHWHDGSTDIRWVMSHPSSHFVQVKAASAGAGFALGLLHLLDTERPPLDKDWGITGDIASDGQIKSVSGYPAKLEAADERRLKVIVPVADLDALREPWALRLLELEGVDTVERASEIASGLMDEILDYLDRLASRLSELPAYYPSGFDFDHIRQRVSVSERRLRYHEEEFRAREAARKAPHSEDEERERAYRWRGAEMFETGERPEASVVGWEQVRKRLKRAVILGDPGFGKTWLLKYEGRQVARGQIKALQSGELVVEEVTLPIYVSLGTLAHELHEAKGDAVEAILGMLHRDFQLSDRMVGWARQQLQGPRCLLLLDGLDEVRSDLRPALARGLDVLARNTRVRMLLTSRIVGYRKPPFALRGDDQERELELVAFDLDQVESFVRTWFKTAPESGDSLWSLLGREPSLRALVGIPLMLSFICLVSSGDQPIPTRRAPLYETVLRLLLEGPWRPRELQEQDSGRIEAKLQLLERVAWHFATLNGVWHDLMPGSELNQVIQDTSQAMCLGEPASQERSLLRKLSERDGVFVKAGEPPPHMAETEVPYLFLHRTLHEFLVARRLARAWQRDRDQTWDFLYPRLHHPDWRDPVLLLVSMIREEDTTRLTERILKAESPYEQELHRDLLLAGECLGSGAQVSQELHHAVGDKLLQLYIREMAFETTRPASQRPLVRRIEKIFGSLGDEGRAYVTASLLTIAKGEDTDDRLTPTKISANLALAARTFGYLARAFLYEFAHTRSVRGIREVILFPLYLKEATSEARAFRQRAAIKAIGNLTFATPQAIPILLAALQEASTRDVSAEALGKVGPGTRDVSMALVDALREHRHAYGWDQTVDGIIEALGTLGQRHADVVELLLDIVKSAESDPYDIRYAVTHALCKAAEASPRAMNFVLEGWRDIYDRAKSPDEPIREGLKEGNKLFAWASPEVIQYLLDAIRESPRHMPNEAADFLSRVAGDTPLVRCKKVQEDGGFRYRTLDLTEEVFGILLRAPSLQMFGNPALPLLVRWGLNRPELIVRLINVVQEADAWLLADILEENFLRSWENQPASAERTEATAFFRLSIARLRNSDKGVRDDELYRWLDAASTTSEDNWHLRHLPTAIETSKCQILNHAYGMAFAAVWKAHELSWRERPSQEADPYVMAALACFRGWKEGMRYFGISPLTAGELREEFEAGVNQALSILQNPGKQAIEVVSPILAGEGAELASGNLEKRMEEQELLGKEPDRVDRWRERNRPTFQERSSAAYALAHLAGDYPEAQTLLISNVKPSSWRQSGGFSPEAEVQEHLVRALGYVRYANQDLVAVLLEIAAKHDRDLYEAGSEALSRLQNPSPEAMPLLMRAYDKLGKLKRSRLVKALCAVEPQTPEIVGLLLSALKDKDKWVRSAAAIGLGDLEEPSARVIDALRAATKHTPEAAEALGKLADRIRPKRPAETRDQLLKTASVLRKSLSRSWALGGRYDMAYEALNRVVVRLMELEVARLPTDFPVFREPWAGVRAHLGHAW